MSFTYRKSILIHAPAEKVWSVITDPACIPQYYFGIDWETDWKKGSPVAFTGVWDHEPFRDKGFILDIEPTQFLHFSYFNPGLGKPDVPENYVVMRFELEAKGPETVFTGLQYGFESEAAFIAVETKWNSLLVSVKELAER